MRCRFFDLLSRKIGFLVAVQCQLTDAGLSAGRRKPQPARAARRIKGQTAPSLISVSRKAAARVPCKRLTVLDFPVLDIIGIQKAQSRDDIIRAEIHIKCILAEFRLPVRLPVFAARRVKDRFVNGRLVRRFRHLVLIVKQHRGRVQIIRAEIHQIFVHDRKSGCIQQRRCGCCGNGRHTLHKKQNCCGCRKFSLFHTDSPIQISLYTYYTTNRGLRQAELSIKCNRFFC